MKRILLISPVGFAAGVTMFAAKRFDEWLADPENRARWERLLPK